MTNPMLSCENFADALADFLERDVDDVTRCRMEAHALSCDDCGSLLADLRSLRIDAANLPDLAPSRDLWQGIAARIETPVVALGAGSGAAARAVRKSGWYTRERGWLGLAAAALVAMTATITHEMTKRSITGPAPTVVASTPVRSGDTAIGAPVNASRQVTATKDSAPGSRASSERAAAIRLPSAAVATPPMRLAADRPSAERTYDSEIARLRIVVNRRRGQLDSATIATIEKNLTVIDEAIAQCKQALRKDPASGFLMESLNEALDNKVQLLRTAASLPSRM
jgi:hypothetical protein